VLARHSCRLGEIVVLNKCRSSGSTPNDPNESIDDLTPIEVEHLHYHLNPGLAEAG
jgi:hypothetical protein